MKFTPKPLRVGLVGCGIGRAHLAAFAKLPSLYEVTAICDPEQERAGLLGAQSGIQLITDDFRRLCTHSAVDVVDICTPPYLHFSQISEAVREGKHVVCEKPLTGSMKEVDELLELECSTGRVIMPIFNYRFGHGVQKLRHLVATGIAGKHYMSTVETSWRRGSWYYESPWRGRLHAELGGVLFQHAIHALDMATFVCGPVRSVFARTATRVNPIETEDCASVSLQFADGSLGTLAATLGSCKEISRHRFCFSNLVAESILDPYRNYCDPWCFTADNDTLQKEIDAALEGFSPGLEGYEGQFTSLHSHLTGEMALPITLMDARLSVQLVTGMYYSARFENPVDLPLSNDHPYYSGWIPKESALISAPALSQERPSRGTCGGHQENGG